MAYGGIRRIRPKAESGSSNRVERVENRVLNTENGVRYIYCGSAFRAIG